MAAKDWPLLDYAIAWTAGPNQSPVQDYWCSVTGRTEGSVQITRGKTYELDQVQPGQMTVTLRNDDGAFDPDNASSPYWPQVIPYRLLRLRAQLPITANMLTQAQASTYTGQVPAGVTSLDGSTITQSSGGSAGNGYTVNVPANGVGSVAFTGWSVTPGSTYTGQAMARGYYVFGGTPLALTVQIGIRWVDATGQVISESLGATYSDPNNPTTEGLVTVTATAPANAAGAALFVRNTTTGNATGSLGVSSVQIEAGSTASTWGAPGVWYPIFTGYVERWPESWSAGGTYGVVDLQVDDYFAFLAQRPLPDPFLKDLLALDPNFLYPLNEQQGAASFGDLTGNRAPITVSATAQSSTTWQAGQSVQSTDNNPTGPDSGTALTGGFLGTAGPVIRSAGSPVSPLTALLIPPDPATGLVGPPPSGGWTRLIAAHATAIPASGDVAFAWGYADPTGVDLFYIDIDDIGRPGGLCGGDSFNGFAYTTAGLLASDTDWHLFGVSLSSDGLTLTVWADTSSTPATATQPSSMRPQQSASGWDMIAGSMQNSTATSPWVGDVALVCELPFTMTGTQWEALARSWRNGWASAGSFTERSDQRYARVLAWAGAGTFPQALSVGASVEYGPATDVAGKNALDVLQSIVDTEAGQHFIAADGTITFQARTDRYNPASTLAFGENTGEVPYQDALFDFDPTRVANDIQVTAAYGNAVYSSEDATSQDDYGQIGLQRTVNSMDTGELQDAADYLTYQNARPLSRLEALPVDLGSNPTLWATLLPLELGQCVTVNRRPGGAPAKQVVGFVEQIVWTLGDDRTASWAVQVSNAARHNFGVFDDTTYGLFDSTLIFGY